MIISDFLRHFLFLRGIRTGNCKSLPSLPLGFDYIDLARRYLMRFCRIRSQCSHVIVEGKWADFADGRCGFFPQRFWAILLMVTLGGMVGNWNHEWLPKIPLLKNSLKSALLTFIPHLPIIVLFSNSVY